LALCIQELHKHTDVREYGTGKPMAYFILFRYKLQKGMFSTVCHGFATLLFCVQKSWVRRSHRVIHTHTVEISTFTE